MPSREWLSRLRDAGCRVWVQVGSVEEGEAALRAGADALIAQGAEAGGHNRAVAATFSLLPALVDAAGAVPVIASEGIADGRGLAAALALGAEAAWLGTRFVASTEAFAHGEYKRRSRPPRSMKRRDTSSSVPNSRMHRRAACAFVWCGSGKVVTTRLPTRSS